MGGSYGPPKEDTPMTAGLCVRKQWGYSVSSKKTNPGQPKNVACTMANNSTSKKARVKMLLPAVIASCPASEYQVYFGRHRHLQARNDDDAEKHRKLTESMFNGNFVHIAVRE